MNRLSPLIIRKVGPFAPIPAFDLACLPTEAQAAELIEDLKLFVTGWIGGLVFFGVFLG